MTRTKAVPPTAHEPAPTPVQTARDGNGRLIALAIDSQPQPPALDQPAWLLACDGSAHALRAATQALALLALDKNVGIHVLNVQGWLGKEAAEAELARRGWQQSAGVRALLDGADLPWRLHVHMGDAADIIKALAEQLDCKGIVIGSSGLGASEALLLGSVAHKVLNQSPRPVLVVR